jgi:hypothetical protein
MGNVWQVILLELTSMKQSERGMINWMRRITMTSKELMEKLKKFDEDDEVIIADGYGDYYDIADVEGNGEEVIISVVQ